MAKRIMHRIVLLFVVCGLILSCLVKMKYIDQATQIKIVSGHSAPGCKFISVNKEDFNSILKQLQKAFHKYPDGFLMQHVNWIVVYEKLNHRGVEYAGTFDRDSKCIFVTLRDGLDYVENIFHHEFNTILLEMHFKSFDKEKWNTYNPENFSYWDTTRGCDYIRVHGTSQPWFDTTYLNQGFLSEYSMTCLDNDLSRYTEALFMSKQDFWDAYEKHQKVRKKADLVIEFYNKLHPIFTEEYFRGLGVQQEVELDK